jgi:Sec-independent protein translocase protein TatA
MFFRIGWSECLIILVILLIVVGLAYRGGYFRARRPK